MPTGFDVNGAPHGIDGSSVHSLHGGSVTALVSELDSTSYGDEIAAHAADRDWIAPRAIAHDSVVTWASDRATVVPFPMWVMFSSDAAVEALLRERSEALAESLSKTDGAREFIVRILAGADAIDAVAPELDVSIASLAEQAANASPGQAYLLRRKLDESTKVAKRDAAGRLAAEAHSALRSFSRSSASVSVEGAERSGLISELAYLVSNDSYDDFRAALTSLVERRSPSGVRYEFTGPWPPYHFARGLEPA